MDNTTKIKAIIESRSIKTPESGCWLWERSTTKQGYGDFRPDKRTHLLAHRASYEAFVAPIPDGLHVLHKCDVRSCVNPQHLFVGTNQDNIRDSMLKGRRKGVSRARPKGLPGTPWTAERKRRRRSTSVEQRAEIKQLSRSGVSQSKIGKLYGISQVTVFKVLHGKYDDGI